MPKDNCPVPPMCGRLARALKVPRQSEVRPINPEEFIVRGTAIKNSEGSVTESSSRQRSEAMTVRRRGTLRYHLALAKEEKEQKRIQKERDDEATIAHAKEVFLRYSLPVRIGEWQNAAYIHQQHVNYVVNRVTNGLTIDQQKQLVLQYLHEKIELSTYSEYLHYEMRVQIVSAGEYAMSNDTEQISSHLMLSTIISETDIIEHKKPYVVQSGSLVTLSHHHCRIRRNVFCFVKCPIEGRPEKTVVPYYENLYIRLFCRGSQKPVYLRCETLNTETLGHNRERMLVTVSETVDKYCQFQLQSLEEIKRLFQIREQVPTFKKVLICHTMTHRYLSVDERLFNGSLSVGREFKGCCFTVKDCNHRFSTKNYWVFKTRCVDED